MAPQEIRDDFRRGPSPHWVRQEIGHGRLRWRPNAVRLSLERADGEALSDAEIGDYQGLSRADLLWRPPIRLQVDARFSAPADQLVGTAGFGFWNHPFPGGRLEAVPQATWFFFASPPTRLSFARSRAGTGWTAATWSGGSVPAPLLWLGALSLRIPGIRRLAMQVADRQIDGSDQPLLAEWMTSRHRYAMIWRSEEVRFSVDGEELHATTSAPQGPLGFVAWMDNQSAILERSGPPRFGHLALDHPQWIELREVSIESLDR